MPREIKAFENPITGEIYKTKAEAKAAENVFDLVKYKELVRLIESGEYWIPKVGEYIYTNTRMSLDHGWDDVCGGVSTVSKVYQHMSGGNAECVFVEISQHERGCNLTQYLFFEQVRLKKEFGEKFAYPDPDYNNYR